MSRKKQSPLEKLVLNTLGEPFYLNIVMYKNWDKWCPIGVDKWAGSTSLGTAVRMRKEAFEDYRKTGTPDWKANEFKTVKVTLYK